MEIIPWTDTAQAIASLIAVPGAIAAFIILFKKDKDKKEQIRKLSNIANHLSKMVDDSERRYIISKKPLISMAGSVDNTNMEINLTCLNSNPNTTINDYHPEIKDIEKPILINPVQDMDGRQRFLLNIPIEELPTNVNVTMKYHTTEGFTYKQLITLTAKQHGTVDVFPRPLTYDNEP